MSSGGTHLCTDTCRHTCGEQGGKTDKGKPCSRLAGWGIPGAPVGRLGYRCAAHQGGGVAFGRAVTRQLRGPLAALLPQQRQFVLEFCGAARGNAARAVRLAGYKAKTPLAATVMGRRLLEHPVIRAAIDAWMAETEMTAKQVTLHIADLAQVTVAPFFKDDGKGGVVLDLTPAVVEEYGHWIESVEFNKKGVPRKLKLHNRQEALRDLAKIHRLYSDAPQLNMFFTQLRNMSDDQVLVELDAARTAVLSQAGGGLPRIAAHLGTPSNGRRNGRDAPGEHE